MLTPVKSNKDQYKRQSLTRTLIGVTNRCGPSTKRSLSSFPPLGSEGNCKGKVLSNSRKGMYVSTHYFMNLTARAMSASASFRRSRLTPSFALRLESEPINESVFRNFKTKSQKPNYYRCSQNVACHVCLSIQYVLHEPY